MIDFFSSSTRHVQSERVSGSYPGLPDRAWRDALCLEASDLWTIVALIYLHRLFTIETSLMSERLPKIALKENFCIHHQGLIEVFHWRVVHEIELF
ncbi:hypothetical protein CDAR_407211 [Caerostris darwini]|uniref:Uncharacterized protein n=1 Tax=Caerostris darwini TaxID=1538125 RepID=A0AAV4Q0R8_9ARAC|nr:hypothetical protein CDAR_407211 [Caerostris darwini]